MNWTDCNCRPGDQFNAHVLAFYWRGFRMSQRKLAKIKAKYRAMALAPDFVEDRVVRWMMSPLSATQITTPSPSHTTDPS